MEQQPPIGRQPYQRFSMHWNSPDGDRYVVEFFKGPTYYSVDINELRDRAWNIHQQGLGYNPTRTMRELVSNMQTGRGGSIYFAQTMYPDVRDVGYVTQRVMVINLKEADSNEKSDSVDEDDSTEEDDETIRVLNVSTKVFLPDHQQKGLGTFFAEQANLMHHPDVFVGRTQNPYVILALRRTGLFDRIYPIDEFYGESEELSDESPDIQKALKIVARRTRNPEANLRTGLCIGVYPLGEERAFVLDKDNREAVEMNRVMTNEIGLSAPNGDAILYTAVVRGGALSSPSEQAT